MSAPAVSVIVVFDRGETEPCLSSLLGQEGVEFEIVAVVPPGLSLPKSSRLTALTVEDRNPARRRNLAAARARGHILAFIDDDAWAGPDWLSLGVKLLDDHPDWAGVGGPNLCPPDAGFRELLTDLVLTTPYIGAGSRAYRGGGERAPAVAGELHLVNFLVRREWFEKVGGLSEALGYGGEDTEFLYQAGKLGAKFYFDPDLTVTHRRRPFGVEYAKQRFRLRLQSARLWGAFPEIYSSNRSFQHLGKAVSMAAVIALLVLIFFRLPGLGLLALFYAILVMALSFPRWRSRLEIAPLAPFAFFIHHAVNLTGFSIGVTRELIKGQGEMREELQRGRGQV